MGWEVVGDGGGGSVQVTESPGGEAPWLARGPPKPVITASSN